MTALMTKSIRFLVVLVALLLVTSTAINAEHINLPENSDGWTIFTASSDSRICYIAENGNDATGRYYSPNDAAIGQDPINPAGQISAFATWAAAYANTRSGYPDWILFKRGETFTESSGLGTISRAGKDADEPFLIGAYGSTGATPIIRTGSTTAINLNMDNMRYLAFVGLDFYSHSRDPNNGGSLRDGNSGINAYWSSNRTATGLLFEGCKFRFYTNNLMQTNGTSVTDFKFRRCTFSDNYEINDHSQGIYTSRLNGLVLDENIFIHNGWYQQQDGGGSSDGQATAFNHNIYFSGSTNVKFIENIFIQGSSANIKITNPYGTSRGALSGMVIDNNLFIDGEVAISAGYNYQPGGGGGSPIEDCFPFRLGNMRISENVVTQIGRSNPTNRGVAWGFLLGGFDNGSVSNNLLINQEMAGINNVRGIGIVGDFRNTALSGNNIVNLQSGRGIRINSNAQASSGNMISRNRVQLIANGEQLIYMSYAGAGEYDLIENTYYTTVPNGSRFYYNGGNVSDTAWAATTDDDFGSLNEKIYNEDTRDIDTYMASIGQTNTIDAFIAACRAQDRYNWNKSYTASVVNNWIKTGFMKLAPRNARF
jgi:hypothetical protein